MQCKYKSFPNSMKFSAGSPVSTVPESESHLGHSMCPVLFPFFLAIKIFCSDFSKALPLCRSPSPEEAVSLSRDTFVGRRNMFLNQGERENSG